MNHDCKCEGNPLLPQVCEIVKIVDETPDIKTFTVKTLDGKKPFTPLPGQLGMFSVVDFGEGMFSITHQGEDYLDFAIKRCGLMTDALHTVDVGQKIGLRGPFGNCFPYEEIKGKDVIIIGGGVGCAPVRSLIYWILEHRADYGKLSIIYGGRSKEDLCFKEDLFENWPKEPNTDVYTTIDRAQEGWDGHVGFVPAYLEELKFSPENSVAVVCGPPIMIKLCMETLSKMGFTDEQLITTLEMRMKCGIGKCGRCNIGSKFICLDGPVFSQAELRDLPDEY